MKLLLHIGTAKTGTTTAQQWLSKNRPTLNNTGLWYPEVGGVNHQWLAILAMDPDKPDDGFYRLGLTDPEKHEAFVSKVSEAFAREYASASSARLRTAVISSEHLQLRLPNDEMVARVARFLADYFTSVEVIIYLRPQVDYAVSSASTASLLGSKVDVDWFNNESSLEAHLDYNQLVDRWEEAFGRSNVRLFSYRHAPSLVEMLIERFGIDRTNTVGVPNLNTALSVEKIALNNALQIPQFNEDNVVNQNRDIPFSALPKGNKLSIGLPLARKIQDRFNKSNRLLAERRDDVRWEDLNPDWSAYDRPSNLHLLDQECLFGRELASLVQAFNGQLHLERAAHAISGIQFAVAQGKVEQARGHLRAALQEIDAAAQIKNLKSNADRMRSIAVQAAQALRQPSPQS
ncbi:hypothetical protein F2P47_00625 [Parvibaculum sedimenti]|uniref:Sulfotransferase family protein n=1 Tax=Parvibaculum sedimenti TaxID=2608632 RepID=A0A6N6VLT5_9HYPH|nr:hypothetical protein [Parvibaculum sedimenti]KAB7742673.1 hypothetical protein F2P47_00625 [Parvibaculum sedimenti]